MFDSIYEGILVYLLIVVVTVVAYYKWSFRYWKNRYSPFLEPSIPFGNVDNPFTSETHLGIHLKQLYDQLKSAGFKYGGMYYITFPKFVLVDTKIIKRIIQQDFNHFTERGFYYNERDDPLSANLFALGGEKWRKLRTKLSPAFTSGKMKMTFGNVLKCAYQMKDAVEKIREEGKAIDAKEIMACYTTDVIGCCAFGLECNSFTHPNAEFRQHGKAIFDFSSKLRLAKTIFAFCFQNLSRQMGITLFDQPCSDFFINVVRNAVQFRKDNNIIRKDMLQLLMELEEGGFLEKESAVKELAAQVFIFFAAGFETSSTTLTFCLFELALNPDIQEKLREEVIYAVQQEGTLTYEAIGSMKYMDQVVDETLRKYPPVSYLTRRPIESYTIPDTRIVIEKGIDALVSIYGLHHDPEYYANPEVFDPERFSEENKRERAAFTFIPFGEGPRICIGARFGLMQVKAGLAILLKSFKFSLNQNTTLPLKFDQYSFTLAPKSEISLDVEKLEE